jgi:phosphoribosyl 1,2-cyclic phosphate phosphodiesterase
MHVDLDYETLIKETPKNVEPAYDGMVLDFEFSI